MFAGNSRDRPVSISVNSSRTFALLRSTAELSGLSSVPVNVGRRSPARIGKSAKLEPDDLADEGHVHVPTPCPDRLLHS